MVETAKERNKVEDYLDWLIVKYWNGVGLEPTELYNSIRIIAPEDLTELLRISKERFQSDKNNSWILRAIIKFCEEEEEYKTNKIAHNILNDSR